MPVYSLNRKTIFHENINNSLIIQTFSSQVFNLNSGSHISEATPIANEAFRPDRHVGHITTYGKGSIAWLWESPDIIIVKLLNCITTYYVK